MRYLVIFTTLIILSSSPSFCMNETTFDEFMQSREVVATFYFENNAEVLSPGETKRVSATLSKLKELQKNGRMIRVEGYSSPSGDREKNFELSFYRARSVAEVLRTGGLPSELALTGYGDLKADEQGASKERRVEIASYIRPAGMTKIQVAKRKAPTITAAPRQVPALREMQEIDSYKVDQAIRSKLDDKAKSIAEQLEELEKELPPGISQSKPLDSAEELERGYSQWRKSIDPDYSPRVTRVIRKNKNPLFGYGERKAKAAEALKVGQAKQEDSDLQRGYSQTKEAPTKDAPKLGQAETPDSDLQRGFTKWLESVEEAQGQDVTLLWPADAPPAVDENAVDVTMVLPDQLAPAIDALMIEQAIMDKIGARPTVSSGPVTRVELSDSSAPAQ